VKSGIIEKKNARDSLPLSAIILKQIKRKKRKRKRKIQQER